LPSVQIVKAAPELYSFACRWYVSSSSWVTLLLAPPFWFVVQFLPVGAGVGEEVDVMGAGAGGALADDDEDGWGSGLGDELSDGVADAAGTRLGSALGDGRADDRDDDEDGPDDDDGTGSALGDDADDAGPDCATQWSRTELAGHSGTLTDTPVSFPDARQA
jgi:hypothetical protein